MAGDNAIDALVTGTTPLSLDSAYCKLSRAAVHAAQESHVAGDNAIDALVTGTMTMATVISGDIASWEVHIHHMQWLGKRN